MAAITGKAIVKVMDTNKVPLSFDIPISTASGLIADGGLWLNAFLAVLDPIIGAQIIDAHLEYEYAIPGGLKAAPVAGVNNGYGLLLNFSTAVIGEIESLWIPAGAVAAYNPVHPNEVNVGDAGIVDAFIAFLKSVTNTTTVTDEDSRNVVALLKAVKSERKQRKALNKRR